MLLRRILALLALVVVLVVIVSLSAREQNSGPGAGVENGEPAPTEPSSASEPGPETPAYPEPANAETLFAWVEARARTLAGSPYQAPDTLLPESLASLGYDAYAEIRYRPERALWQGETPFQVQLFHRGSIQVDRVKLHLVEDGRVRALPFEAERFRYGGAAVQAAGAIEPGLGYAGFRIHHPLNRPDVADEVAVFLGASYFRLLGPGQVHGLSSRGLAVDVAAPDGEEFPRFRAFWLIRPEPEAGTLTFLGLLDSPSVAGAYRFDLTPGQGGDGGDAAPAGPDPTPTQVEVDARLFARRDVGKLGVAPLTSMFLHGPERAAEFDDFRPRVHDSHGLLMHTGAGEWIWRPLSNGPGLRVTSLQDHDPQGFGLVQRERDFRRYLDLEARYHRRPSEWVAVGEGDWGSGNVELVEIPTSSEFNDNIVASWVPDAPFRAGDQRRYTYRLRTFDARLPQEELARVARWRTGGDVLPGAANAGESGGRRFVVDFVPPGGTGASSPGPEGAAATARDASSGVATPELVLASSTGQVSDLQVFPLPEGEGWRASFRLAPESGTAADLRLHLVRDGRPVTETWSYLWDPEEPR